MSIFQGFGKKKKNNEKLTAESVEAEAVEKSENTAKEDEQPEVSGQGGYEKVDVNKPLENFRLKVLLNEMKENRTDSVMNMIFDEIVMKAHFLSVVFFSQEPEANDGGTATFRKDTVMRLPMLSSQDGKSFYPVFTDHEELAKWQQMEKPKTLILTFDDYASMVLKNEQAAGIVVNPFSNNLVLDRRMIEHLKTQKDLRTKGVAQHTITKDTKVMLGEPKEYPTAMVEAIKACLQSEPQVRRAWLRLMLRDGLQSFLVIVDHTGEKDVIFPRIANAARPHLKNMYLDMVAWQEGFGQSAVQNVEPFYQK